MYVYISLSLYLSLSIYVYIYIYILNITFREPRVTISNKRVFTDGEDVFADIGEYIKFTPCVCRFVLRSLLNQSICFYREFTEGLVKGGLEIRCVFNLRIKSGTLCITIAQGKGINCKTPLYSTPLCELPSLPTHFAKSAKSGYLLLLFCISVCSIISFFSFST